MWPTAAFTCLLSVCSGWEFSLTLLSSCTMSGILNKIWKLYLNWSKLTIVLLLQQKNSRGVVMHWHIPLTHTHTDTNRAHKRTWILQSLAVFPALMDPITLSKTAQTEPYGEPIAMVIQLFLMDTLPIINLWGGGGFSRQIAAHVVNVHYANLRCREVVMSHEVGGVIYSPFIMEEPCQ